MKKRLLIFAVLIFSVVFSFYVGVASFSEDNIKNTISKLENERFEPNGSLELFGWTYADGKYISDEDSQLIIRGADVYIRNIRIDAIFDSDITSVDVFYTEGENEVFTADKMLICPVTVKNSDVYITLDRQVFDLRIDLYPNKDRTAVISGIEINPTKLNVNTVRFVFSFLFPFLIGYSLINIIFDRESLKKDVFAMKRYKYLLSDLVSKDIKTKYRRSVLGVLWSILNPLLMMAVLTTIFSHIIRIEVEGGFALFYLTGYLMFNFISEATGFSLFTITSAAPLIKKVYIPKYVFPLEKCIFSFVNMLFSLIAFVMVFVVFCITGKTSPNITMLMFPIPMIYIFVFCLGLCLALSALVVFFRDIGHIWSILLTVWMYASPIIYPVDILPSWLAQILRLNPLTHYIDYFRNVMIYGRVPTLEENLICVFYSLSVFLLGVVIFRKKQDKFLLYI